MFRNHRGAFSLFEYVYVHTIMKKVDAWVIMLTEPHQIPHGPMIIYRVSRYLTSEKTYHTILHKNLITQRLFYEKR